MVGYTFRNMEIVSVKCNQTWQVQVTQWSQDNEIQEATVDWYCGQDGGDKEFLQNFDE